MPSLQIIPLQEGFRAAQWHTVPKTLPGLFHLCLRSVPHKWLGWRNESVHSPWLPLLPIVGWHPHIWLHFFVTFQGTSTLEKMEWPGPNAPERGFCWELGQDRSTCCCHLWVSWLQHMTDFGPGGFLGHRVHLHSLPSVLPRECCLGPAASFD
jgi:hypothetical protein